ncbi:unnamed protein product [Amoebophrya sp. A25]|nr:unnamed protein product [Amoebophrya sp. A25]|eukprot:GSA25T00009400001.1
MASPMKSANPGGSPSPSASPQKTGGIGASSSSASPMKGGGHGSPSPSPDQKSSASPSTRRVPNVSPRITNQVELAMAYPSLYGAPSYASIFSEPVDFEPGPGQYDMPSALGQQVLSRTDTLPSISILAKHSSSWSKVYISKYHAIKARDTPGPGSYTPGLLNAEGSVRFGTAVRKEVAYDTESPGPVYDIRKSASDSNFGAGKFGQDDRWRGLLEFGGTGPGQYNAETSFDGTTGLQKSFAVGHRAYDRVRFPGCDRVNLGRASPGPGQFRNWQPAGRKCAFPRSLRKPLYDPGSVDSSVGPGSYNSTDSLSKSYSYGFGKPSVRSRLSWKRDQVTMSNWCRLGMAKTVRDNR